MEREIILSSQSVKNEGTNTPNFVINFSKPIQLDNNG